MLQAKPNVVERIGNLELEQHAINIATPIFPKIHFVLVSLDSSADSCKIKWLVIAQLIKDGNKD